MFYFRWKIKFLKFSLSNDGMRVIILEVLAIYKLHVTCWMVCYRKYSTI